jgi:hypothetical protein
VTNRVIPIQSILTKSKLTFKSLQKKHTDIYLRDIVSFAYSPSVLCPLCEYESDWNKFEDSTRYPEGIACPYCERVVPVNQYHVIPKWRCSSCKSDVLLIDCIDYGEGTFGCPNCEYDGKVTNNILKFERLNKESGIEYRCPNCDVEILASDLIPLSKGEIIICPVCERIAEI